MTKPATHETYEETHDQSDSPQIADFYNALEMLDLAIDPKETLPDRTSSSFLFTEFEAPLFVPEAIQRYREVMVPLSSIRINVESDDAGMTFSADIVSKRGDSTMSFQINDTKTDEGFEIISNAEISHCSRQEMTKMIVGLALPPQKRAKVFESEATFDLQDPTIALLITSCLEAQAQEVMKSPHYKLALDTLNSPKIELTISTSADNKKYQLALDATDEDGPVSTSFDALIEIEECVDPDSADVSYPISITSRRRQNDEYTSSHVEIDQAPDDAIVEYAIEVLSRVRIKQGNSPEVSPMKIGSIIYILDKMIKD